MANLFAKCVPVVLLLSVWLQSSGAQFTVDDVTRVFPPVNESDSRTPLYVALMLAFSGGFVSAPIAPGVQIALNLINADQSLLPGYTLHYTFSDSQCNGAVALDSFFNQVVGEEPIKIALIGAGCSVATEPTAAVSHFYNITQLACGSSSAGLEDRERFRKYFQLIPNDLELVPAYFGLMQLFGWNDVVIIQQEEDLFSLTVESLQERFNAANRQREMDGIPLFTTVVKTFNSNEGIADLEERGVDLFDEFATIHILAMYSDNAREVICEAFKRGMTSPEYVFMTYAWYLNYWWVPRGDVECTVEEMEQVLERSPTILSDPGILNSSEVVEAGITHTRFVDESINILEDEFEGQFDYLYNAEHCFDGVWALAYALNRTIQDLEEDPEFSNRAKCEAEITEDGPFRIDDFNYNVSSVGNRIFFHLENTDFRGVTGDVSFNSMGIRDVDRVRIQQFRRNNDDGCNPDNGACLNRVEIASVSVGEAAFSYLPGEDNETTWPGGVPDDGIPNRGIITISTPLTALMSAFTSAGIVFVNCY